MDTNTTATVSPTATVVTRRPRLKDAIAEGICDGTKSVVKMVDSGAEILNACAVRVKLHNVSTAADILDEFGSQKVTEAQELIKGL